MSDKKAFEWPERIVLRDTTVYADEGQRIFSNATGYGYEKREYVRADIAGGLMEPDAIRPLEVGDAVCIGSVNGTEGRVTAIRDNASFRVFYFNTVMQRPEEHWYSRQNLHLPEA